LKGGGNMSIIEIIVRYGRRFVLMDFGEDKYFDFYEIKADDGEVFAVDTHVTIQRNGLVSICEDMEISIDQLGDMLELYTPEESVFMVPNTDLGRLSNEFYHKAVIVRKAILNSEGASEKELNDLGQEIVKIARRIELVKTFRKYA
jgi:hypothetical protein